MCNYSSTNDLILELKDSILTITLNRPDSHNAFTSQMIIDLCSNLKTANFDNEVKVIILTGAGKSFCAGGDVKAMIDKSGMFAGESSELMQNYQAGIQQIPLTIESLQKPIIAKVNGAAIGAGCDLAAMCDIRIGSKFSKFGETFSKLNLVPGDGGTYFLPRVIGYAKAMEMYLTGRIYSAEEAFSMGLLNQIVDVEQLTDVTQSMAKEISSNGYPAITMIKKAMKLNFLKDLQTSLDMLGSFQGITQRTDEHFQRLK